MKLVGMTLLFLVSLGADLARANEAAKSNEKMPAGQRLFFAAELGTTPDILGMGFEEDLSPSDAGRVFPAKFQTVAVNQYNAQFSTVENGLSLQAHARYLFAKAGVRLNTNRRYMVVRVEQVNKVLKLKSATKKTDSSAPLYASKLHYGWALYVVIEGDAKTFTAEVAASLIAAGGSLAVAVRRNKLTSRVFLIGLKPKRAGDIPIAVTTDEVLSAFQTSSDQPIYVEYTLTRGVETESVPWEQGAPASRVTKNGAFEESNLTPDIVLAKIQSAYMASIKRCYKDRLARDSTARGRVILSLTVNETGRTTQGSSKGFARELDDCITGLMKSWRFAIPKDRDGEATESSFAISLTLAPE